MRIPSAGDWASVETESARLKGQVASRNVPLAKELAEFEMEGRFRRAMGLMETERWSEASALFLGIGADAPRSPLAAKSVFNAARCLESDHRPGSARSLYERVASEYPDSDVADEAFFRAAYLAESVFDFARAAKGYQQLVETRPGSSRRKDALYNAARMHEILHRHEEAARGFVRYADLDPGSDEARGALFRAALLFEKARDRPRTNHVLQELERRMAGHANPDLLVSVRLHTGLAEDGLGRERAARVSYQAAVEEFARSGLDPGKEPAAASAAAEARFRLAEGELARSDSSSSRRAGPRGPSSAGGRRPSCGPAMLAPGSTWGRRSRREGDYPGAVSVLERAVELVPGNASAWLDLGNAYRGVGRGEAARQAYERALGIDGGVTEAHFNLGLLYWDGDHKGLPADARLQRAVAHFDQYASSNGKDATVERFRTQASHRLELERQRQASNQVQRERDRVPETGRSSSPAQESHP